MEFLMNLFLLIGRVLISGAFLWGAYEKATHWHATLAYLRAKGVPYLNLTLPALLIIKILGGLLILFGWHAHIGALLLLIVAIPSLFWLHAFWKHSGGDPKMERAIFMKELAIIGGLFLILALGAGHFAISG